MELVKAVPAIVGEHAWIMIHDFCLRVGTPTSTAKDSYLSYLLSAYDVATSVLRKGEELGYAVSSAGAVVLTQGQLVRGPVEGQGSCAGSC